MPLQEGESTMNETMVLTKRESKTPGKYYILWRRPSDDTSRGGFIRTSEGVVWIDLSNHAYVTLGGKQVRDARVSLPVHEGEAIVVKPQTSGGVHATFKLNRPFFPRLFARQGLDGAFSLDISSQASVQISIDGQWSYLKGSKEQPLHCYVNISAQEPLVLEYGALLARIENLTTASPKAPKAPPQPPADKLSDVNVPF